MAMTLTMNKILTKPALILLALAVPATASAQPTLEGRWANPHHSVIVKVGRCGDAYCGTVSWANANNRQKGTTPGTRVLYGLRPAGDGTYRGSVYEPKREMRGSATVRQVGDDVMVVKGCAMLGLICKEQRWTRVG
jgi:uncharacterized protein (DUF2147 family)